MPELGEVEYNRRRWEPGTGDPVRRVLAHPRVRIFRGTNVARLRRLLPDSVLVSSEARGKQLLFRFRPDSGDDLWLGIHLGMTGDLRIEPDPAYPPARHDHLVLTQAERALVFSDPRQFGRVTFDVGREAPLRWRELPPEVLSSAFTPALLGEFLRRHARAPVKAVLLRQERFPGIGNWMADEVLYRSRIHPGVAAGSLDGDEVARLHREIRTVSRVALRRIGERWGDLPRDWLFHRRWEDGGICPRTGAGLVRETIGGRTTCYSPEWQGEARRSATGSRRSPTSSRRPGSGSRRGDGEPESSKA